jgi:hypothetical protein
MTYKTKIYVDEQAISKQGTIWDLSGNTKFSGGVNIHGFDFDLSATTLGDSIVFDGVSYKPSKAAGSFTGGTVTGNTIFNAGISASTISSGSTDLNLIFERQSDFNTYTGNTNINLNNKYDVTGGTINGNVVVTGNTNVHGNLSGNTLFSGGTNLNSIFERISDFNIYTGNTNNILTGITTNITSLQTGKADLTGSTFTGNVIAPSITANTSLYGGSILSGGTDLNNIFQRIGSDVDPITKYDKSGGTINGNVIVTGTTNVQGGLTGLTISSGGTDLNNIFERISDLNIYTGNTNININNKYDKTGGTISGNVVVTGNTSVQAFTGSSISSGSTDLNLIFERISDFNIYTGSTYNTITGLTTNINKKADLSGATFNGNIIVPAISATSITGTSIYGNSIFSGSTNLNSIFEKIITTGSTLQYWRGDKTFQTLDTSVVPENINLYWTQARFNTAFSGKSTSDLIEGSNLYFTNARTDARIFAVSGVANGLATLDNSGKLLLSQIPSSLIGAVIFQGFWSADTNNPPLSSGTGTKGYYYIVSRSGTTSLDGVNVWRNGDWAVFDGTIWDKIDNNNSVVTVNTKTGNVVLTTTDINEGTNLYWTQSRFDAAFTGKSTTNLLEGTNLYFTNSRVLNTTLNGLDVTLTGNITSGDTTIQGFGRLQNQLSNFDLSSKYDKTGGTISGNVIVTGNTNVQGNLSGTTLFSGGTNLNSIFERQIDFNVYTANTNTILNNKYDVTGGTINGNVIVTGTTFIKQFTATTISSGSTDLNNIFERISDFNVYTANTNTTLNGITANISSLSANVITNTTNITSLQTGKADLSGATFTGNIKGPSISGTSVSATTIYGNSILSAGTDLNLIFEKISDFNIYTGNTNINVNNKYDITGGTINGNVIVTGNTNVQGNLSGGSIFSGSTNLNSIFERISDFNTYSATTNTTIATNTASILTKYDITGGTINGNVIVTGNTNVQGNLTGLTISSGATNLNSIFERISDFNTYTGNTNNTITANTANIILKYDKSGGTISGNVIVTGTTSLQALTATTISSGGTDLNNIFERISDFNTYTGNTNTNINNKYDVTGGTINGNVIVTGTTNIQGNLSGGTLFSGNTNLNSIFERQIDFNVYTANTNTNINNKYDKSGGTISGIVSINVTGLTAQLNILPSSSSVIGEIIKLNTGQSADAFQILDTNSNKLVYVSSAGTLNINAGASVVDLILYATSGQTVDIFQALNNTSNKLVYITSAGTLTTQLSATGSTYNLYENRDGNGNILSVFDSTGSLFGGQSAGTSVSGNNITIKSGQGTGSGSTSYIMFQTPTVGVSGSSLQTLVTRLQVGVYPSTSSNTIWLLSGSPSSTNYTLFGDGNSTTINSPSTSLDFRVANVVIMRMSGTTINTGSAGSVIYRTTNAGANIFAHFMIDPASSISSAGALGYAFDTTNGLSYTHSNGTLRVRGWSAILTNLGNTAGSEFSDYQMTPQNITDNFILNGGNFKMTNFSGTTNRFITCDINGNLQAIHDVIPGQITNATIQSYLSSGASWTNTGVYSSSTATTITSTYQTQWYNDSNYYYFFTADNVPIRIPQAQLVGNRVSITLTGNTTLDQTYSWIWTNGTFTITLPSASSYLDKEYVIKNIVTGTTVTITGNVDGVTGRTLTTQYQVLGVKSNGSNWYIMHQM